MPQIDIMQFFVSFWSCTYFDSLAWIHGIHALSGNEIQLSLLYYENLAPRTGYYIYTSSQETYKLSFRWALYQPSHSSLSVLSHWDSQLSHNSLSSLSAFSQLSWIPLIFHESFLDLSWIFLINLSGLSQIFLGSLT